MNEEKGVSKTTISSSVFTKMSQSFAEGEYLLDDAIREPNASLIFICYKKCNKILMMCIMRYQLYQS